MESFDDRSYLLVHLWRSTSRKMTYPLFLCATFYMSVAVCCGMLVTWSLLYDHFLTFRWPLVLFTTDHFGTISGLIALQFQTTVWPHPALCFFAIKQSPFNLLFPLPELLPLTLLCSRHSIPGGGTNSLLRLPSAHRLTNRIRLMTTISSPFNFIKEYHRGCLQKKLEHGLICARSHRIFVPCQHFFRWQFQGESRFSRRICGDSANSISSGSCATDFFSQHTQHENEHRSDMKTSYLPRAHCSRWNRFRYFWQ